MIDYGYKQDRRFLREQILSGKESCSRLPGG
jgi:hypothetical protein